MALSPIFIEHFSHFFCHLSGYVWQAFTHILVDGGLAHIELCGAGSHRGAGLQYIACRFQHPFSDVISHGASLPCRSDYEGTGPGYAEFTN